MVKACGIGAKYDPINLMLNKKSSVEDYQGGLVIRKSEINKLNRGSEQQAICVAEIQRYMK